MNATVLVTGGFGYLGGRIAAHLAQHGRSVRLASRAAHVAPAWLPQAQTVVFDLERPQSFASALHGVRAVVHLAAVNEIESAADPLKAVHVNTRGTVELLTAAIHAGVERFIYLSTAHVYGAPLQGHITEHTTPRPTHPYAITHRAAEDFVLAAHDRGATLGVVLRLSNSFGAPTHAGVNRWTLLVNDLCRQAVIQRSLTLRSDGMQLRDFVALSDVARATGHVLRLARPACGDGLFNLGGNLTLSVWDMAQRVAQCCEATLGYRPPLSRVEPSGAAPGELRYDIAKLTATGFHLHGGLDEEIAATLRLCALERGRADE